MSDRELLELAAKAAGIEDISYYLDDFLWNPLADDGDALRLAVKLRMDLMLYSDTKGAFIGSRGGNNPQFAEVSKDDPYAATRRAIVRAAAEIGKGDPLTKLNKAAEDNGEAL